MTYALYSFLNAVEDISATMQLARVRGISNREAALLVLAELGWSEAGVTEEFKRQHRRGVTSQSREENLAYEICKAIKQAAESLGAPMTTDRLYESGA